MKSASFSNQFQFQDCEIPVKVYFEYRSTSRYALGKNSFIFRIPQQLESSKRQEVFRNGISWAENLLKRKPSALNIFRPVSYRDGDVIAFYDKKWSLSFSDKGRPSIQIKGKENTIYFNGLSNEDNKCSDPAVSKAMQKLLSQYYRQKVFSRASEIAAQKELPAPSELKLKYMSSRWGSCLSTGGKVNLNTRLLLAPVEVLDSVIVHELCHFIHMDHSRKFWNLVFRCCPDYQTHSRWLKINGNLLRL